MLRIAAVANNYPECKRFIEYKFNGLIKEVNNMKGIYILTNGDEVHMCFDENDRHRYNSMVFDAMLISENYQSLADVIRHRTGRPR